MTRIKMCGLRRPEDIRAANEVRPEYVGFVFFPGSKRYVTPETARELKAGLVPEIRTVGVFVDEKPETVAGLLADGTIDIAQLHGNEDADYIKDLKYCKEVSYTTPLINSILDFIDSSDNPEDCMKLLRKWGISL